MSKLVGFLFAIFAGFFVAALVALFYGIIFMVLWNYVSPVFWPSAPQLSVLQAIATVALLGCIAGPLKPVAVKGK